MKKRKLKALSLLLAALMLCMTAVPAAAAAEEAAESATAASMQLMKTEGTVNLTNSSGRGMTIRNNMRLYNGYHVETKAKSYAWINLDSEKLTKLDAVSEAEVRKSGKVLELLVNSGSLFFNVTRPLEEGETLNIRTATMAVGIRGTSGWIRVTDRWNSEIYVLEGTVQCSVTDPVTGQVKTAEIRSGEKAVAAVYPQDKAGDKCDILFEGIGTGDIDGFVLAELAEDPGLCESIFEASGLDVQSAAEHAQERLEQDEQRMQEKLDYVEEQIAAQDSTVATGAIWEPAETTASPSGGDDSGDSGGTGSIVSLTMPQTVTNLQNQLNNGSVKEVRLAASSADDILHIDAESGLTVPEGKTLAVDSAIDITVHDRCSLTVKGTMTGGSITNYGELTVESPNSLKVLHILNYGALTNAANGYIETEEGIGSYGGYLETSGRIKSSIVVASASDLTVSGGMVDGTIGVRYGSFTMEDGTVNGGVSVFEDGVFAMEGGTVRDGGDDNAVLVNEGASFAISGGEVISSSFCAVNFYDWKDLHLTGGKITSNGAAYALYGGNAVLIGPAQSGTIIRAMDEGRLWGYAANDGTVQSVIPLGYALAGETDGDGYHYLEKSDGPGGSITSVRITEDNVNLLAEALSAEDDREIVLDARDVPAANLTLDASTVIRGNKILDLNGNQLTVTGTVPLTTSPGSELLVRDSNGNGALIMNNSVGDTLPSISANGNLIWESGRLSFSDNGKKDVISVTGAAFTMYDGRFEYISYSANPDLDYVVSVTDGTFTMYGGWISSIDNSNRPDSGAVTVNNSTFRMRDGTVVASGTAVRLNAGSTFIMEDGEVTSASSAPTVWSGDLDQLSLIGGTIANHGSGNVINLGSTPSSNTKYVLTDLVSTAPTAFFFDEGSGSLWLPDGYFAGIKEGDTDYYHLIRPVTAEDGDTIILTQDTIWAPESIGFEIMHGTKDKPVILDLNGHTLTVRGDGSGYPGCYIFGALEIRDSSGIQDGTLALDGVLGGLNVMGGSHLTLTGGTIIGRISVQPSGASFTITGGAVVSEDELYFTVYCDAGSTLNLTGGSIINNYSEGPALFVDSTCEITLTGTAILAKNPRVCCDESGDLWTPEGWKVSDSADGNGYFTLEPVTP